jgi:hypothetical protein
MPRIGGKAKAVLPLTLTERVPAGTTPNPAHPLDDAIQQSNARTVDELIKSRKRVWNTKGRLRRARFRTEVEMLRLEGFSPADTAQILGVSRQQISAALKWVRENADMPSQLERLDKIGIPLAVDNALLGIEQGDKEYTLRLLDGRGIFRTHKSIESQVTQKVLMLQIQVVDARQVEGAAARPGAIVGVPETFNPALPVIDQKAIPEPAAVGVSGPADLS